MSIIQYSKPVAVFLCCLGIVLLVADRITAGTAALFIGFFWFVFARLFIDDQK